MDIESHDAIARSFHEAVNMTPAALERWLGTTGDSRAVGRTHEGEGEAVGHRAGARFVEIKRTRKADLCDGDDATGARSRAPCSATWRSGPRATCATRAGGTR